MGSRFFNKLGTPNAVVAILVLLLAVNGFLLYRQATTSTTSAPPTPLATQDDTTPASGTAEAPGGSSEPENPVPLASAPTAEAPTPKTLVSSDLREAIRQCEGDRKECVREFVADAAPEAKYIGGRIDLNASGSGRNKEIFYFEDPNLGTCENTRQEYATKDGITTVIILGQGSFDEGGSECVPET